MEWLILGILVAAIVFLVVSGNSQQKLKEERLKDQEIRFKEVGVRLKTAYETALASGDKRAALEAGRKYYSYLRKGELTLYDEQAIANDLSAMKQQP